MRLVIEARLAGEGNDTDHGADGVLEVIARLDQFLCRNGVATNERVTMISDDADKFAPGQAGFSIGSASP